MDIGPPGVELGSAQVVAGKEGGKAIACRLSAPYRCSALGLLVDSLLRA